MDKQAAQSVLKSFSNALKLRDVSQLRSLQCCREQQDAILAITSENAKEYITDSLAMAIGKAGGERVPVSYTKDVHRTFLMFFRSIVAQAGMLQQHRKRDVEAAMLVEALAAETQRQQAEQIQELQRTVQTLQESLAQSDTAAREVAERAACVEQQFRSLDSAVSEQRRITAELQKDRAPFGYGGVFKSGQATTAGTFVTFGGSLWYCKRDTKKSPPGSEWQLVVQRGRDGRDLRPAPEGDE